MRSDAQIRDLPGRRVGERDLTSDLKQGPWWNRVSARTATAIVMVELVVLLFIWQLIVGQFGLIHPLFLPPPLEIFGGLWQMFVAGELWTHLLISLKAWLMGYSLAVGVGVVAGLIVGSSVSADRLVKPLLWTIYATPWLAYRPLTVAWFGFGIGPVTFLVFIAALFPILLNTSAGVHETDSSLLDAGRVFGARRSELYRKIVLPSTLSFTLAGMRQGAVVATTALLVAEILGATKGLGALITIKTNTFQTGQAFAAILIAVVWSVSISQLIRFLGKRLAPWQSGGGTAA